LIQGLQIRSRLHEQYGNGQAGHKSRKSATGVDDPERQPQEPSAGAKIILKLNMTSKTVTNPEETIPIDTGGVTAMEQRLHAGAELDSSQVAEEVDATHAGQVAANSLLPSSDRANMPQPAEETLRITSSKRGRPSGAPSLREPKNERQTRGGTGKTTAVIAAPKPASRRSLRLQNVKVSESVRKSLASDMVGSDDE